MVHSRSHPAADSLGVEGRVCRTHEIRAAFAAQAALHAVHHVADSQVAISVNHDDGAPHPPQVHTLPSGKQEMLSFLRA